MKANFYAETFRQSLMCHAFPHGGAICGFRSGQLIVAGTLKVATNLCKDNADIRVSFGMSDWLTEPPQVIATADWLQPHGATDRKCYADWHRYSNGMLCWTRPDRWHTMIAQAPENVDRMAASLVKDVSVLLECHLLADCLGLTQWQPEWPFCEHGSYKGG